MVTPASTASAPPAAAPLAKARRTFRTIAVAPSGTIGFNCRVAETRGMRYLRQQRVPFDVHTYEHVAKGAEFAAQALGLPLERFAKTLVVEAGGDPVFVLMPGHRELSAMTSPLRLRRSGPAGRVDSRLTAPENPLAPAARRGRPRGR